jgi:hypothetical protein
MTASSTSPLHSENVGLYVRRELAGSAGPKSRDGQHSKGHRRPVLGSPLKHGRLWAMWMLSSLTACVAGAYTRLNPAVKSLAAYFKGSDKLQFQCR